MTMVCFVPFSDSADFDRESFRREIDSIQLETVKVSQVERASDDIFQIDFHDTSGSGIDPGAVFVSRMPALAIEPGDYNPLWLTASQDLANHESHWIVTTAASKLSLVDQAWLVTRVVEAILRSHPTAIGVLWNKHGLKVSADSFLEVLDTLEQDALPISLWIEITISPSADDDSPMIALTTGMRTFDLMEIESIRSPESVSDMYARIFGICQYLLTSGPVLRHGDTLGESNDERITVLHIQSVLGRQEKVIFLRYPGGDDSEAVPPQGGFGSGLKSIAALIGVLLFTGALIFGIVQLVGAAVATLQSNNAPENAPMSLANSDREVLSPVESGKAPSLPTIESTANENRQTRSDQTASSLPTTKPEKSRETIDAESSFGVFREWTDRDGQVVIEAAIIGVERIDGRTIVRLKTSNGQTESVAYDSLSDYDQTRAKTWYKRETERPTDANGNKLPMIDDAVLIKWGSSWWEGKVIGQENDRYEVGYNGWGSSSNEWMTLDKLRWPDDTPFIAEP